MKTDRNGAAGRRGVAGATYISVLLAVVLAAVLSGASLAQVPDNRDLRLDPEDSVPPAYRETLDERDRQRLDAARRAGETFIPMFQGPSRAPGDAGPAAGAATRDRAPTPPQPAYESYRRPERSAAPASGGEGRGAGDLVGVLIEAWTRPPEIVRVRYPAAAARSPDPTTPGDPMRRLGNRRYGAVLCQLS